MRRRSSPLWMFVSLILSGGVGLLAGYGVLRLWHDHELAANADSAAATPVAASPPAAPSTSKSTSSRREPAAAKGEKRPAAANNILEPAAPAAAEAASDRMPQPPAANTVDAAVTNAAPLKQRPQTVLDVDLTRNRQQQVFDASAKGLQITSLEGCDSDYEIKPNAIVVKAPRDVVIEIAWENLANGKRRVTLEPTVKTDAGKTVPFTLRSMDNIKRQTGQDGEQATAALAALKLEQQNLTAYIKPSTRKTAAQASAARARLDQLKKLIPAAELQLTALQASYDVAARMSELAESLHEKCHILLEDPTAIVETTSDPPQPNGGETKQP